MRDSLTILAIIVIALLTAALVGPYFIDWNSHRALVEARLSKAAGVPVTIAGRIDVRLLPEPVFRLGHVMIGGGDPDEPRMSVDEIDVDIALTALMRGEIQVAEARLLRPTVDLSAAANGNLHLTLPRLVNPAAVSFQHLVIRNGALSVTLGDRGIVRLDGLDLEGEAAALNGPFKAKGSFGTPDDRHPFRLATGAFDGHRMRVKLDLDGETATGGGLARPSVDFDGLLAAGNRRADATDRPAAGSVAPAGAAPRKSGVKAAAAAPPAPAASRGPSFAGSVTVAGALPLAGSNATVPWRFTGEVLADSDHVTASTLELRAGTDMRALIATGDGSADLVGPQPAARLKLHGPALDLNALGVAPEGSQEAAPAGFDLVQQLAPLTADPRWLAALPLRLDLDYGFDTATVGEETFFEIGGQLHLDGDAPPRVTFAASGPEGAHLKLDGSFEPGPEAVFRGRIDAGSRNLPRFAGWLAPALSNLADSLHRLLPVRVFALSGTADLSRVGIAARDLTLSLDRSVFSGTLSYTRQVGGERARLFADLASDALDLDALPDLSAALSPSDLDVALTLDAKAVNVTAVGAAPIEAGHVALGLSKTGAALDLDRFDAELAGAKLMAKAHFDGAALTGQAHVAAGSFDGLAALLDRILPNAATAALRARATALSPADLSLKLGATLGADGALLPTALSLDGTLGDTKLAGAVEPDRPGGGNAVALSLSATAPEATALLRQLGFPGDGPARLGPGRIEVKAHGAPGTGFDTHAEARLGPARITFDGNAKPRLGGGRLVAQSEDVAPVLRAAGLGSAGGGPWPADAAADLAWHDAELALRHLDGRLGDGHFAGDVDLDLTTAAAPAAVPTGTTERPALFGTLSLDRLPATALFGLMFGAPQAVPAGAFWSDKPFEPQLATLPRTALSLKIGSLDLGAGHEARNASLTLRADRSSVTLANLTGAIDGGSVAANLTLRRDGPLAALSGQVSWAGLPLDLPAVTGRFGGVLDLGGTGNSAGALMASLAGTGSLTLLDARLPRTDPEALLRAAALVDRAAGQDPGAQSFESGEVTAVLGRELDRAPLVFGTVTGAATLAAGALRIGGLQAESDGWTAASEASFDLVKLELAAKTLLKSRPTPPDWTGAPPEVTITLQGPLKAPVRSVDASAFINGLQARAIARDQQRIDIQNQDIRERAYFNRRLKAIEADQEAARQRAKAEAEAARAAARERTLAPSRPLNIRPPASAGANPAGISHD